MIDVVCGKSSGCMSCPDSIKLYIKTGTIGATSAVASASAPRAGLMDEQGGENGSVLCPSCQLIPAKFEIMSLLIPSQDCKLLVLKPQLLICTAKTLKRPTRGKMMLPLDCCKFPVQVAEQLVLGLVLAHHDRHLLAQVAHDQDVYPSSPHPLHKLVDLLTQQLENVQLLTNWQDGMCLTCRDTSGAASACRR